MIPSKFFSTTSYDVYAGSRLSVDPRTITDLGNDGSFGNGAYWLGWIRPENVPSALCESRWDTSGDTIKLYNVVRDNPQNLNIGYYSMAHSAPNYGNPGGNVSYGFNASTPAWVLRPSTPYNGGTAQPGAFLNSFRPQCDGVAAKACSFNFYIIYRYGTSLYELNNFGQTSTNIAEGSFTTAESLINFVKGNTAIPISFGILGQEITIDYTANSEPWQKYNVTIGNYYVEYYIGIVDYLYYGYGANTGTNTSSSSRPCPLIEPAFLNDANGNRAIAKAGFRGRLAANSASSFTTFDTRFLYRITQDIFGAFTSPHDFVWNDTFIGGADAVFDKVVIANMRRVANSFQVSGNVVLTYLSMDTANNTIVLEAHIAFTADDLYKHLALMPRVFAGSENNSTPFGLGEDIYISEVLATGEFTANLITGTEEELGDRLRNWQKENGNITDNEYTEDDKPEYTPPGEGEREYNDEDKFSGNVDFPFLPNIPGFQGFITQYVFTGGNVNEFARSFWNRLVSFDSSGQLVWDSSFVSNFIIALANTGTLDISNLLDYIVSVQVFPFDIADACAINKGGTYTSLSGNQVFLGAGILGIPLDATHGIAGKIDQMAVQFNGFPYRFVPRFNDFRDFTATSIELYIPFCGSISIDPNMAYDIVNGQVVGNYIKFSYAVDLQTGHLTVGVVLTDSRALNIIPLASVTGKCSVSIPLSAGAFGQMISRMVGTIGTGIAAAGSMVERAGTHVESTLGTEGLDIREVQNTTGMIGEARRSVNTFSSASPFSPGRMSASPLSDMFLQIRHPYVVYRTGRYHTPNNYPHTFGKQYLYRANIGSQPPNSFVKCVNVDCSGLSAQSEEKEMIRSLLESGVYL